jgi:hypothetical protein
MKSTIRAVVLIGMGLLVGTPCRILPCVHKGRIETVQFLPDPSWWKR